MPFFKNLFGKSNNHKKQDPLADIEVVSGFIIPQAFVDHWHEIKKTEKEFISINATPSDNLTLQQSKFGHYPCIPKGFPYPLDRLGNYMFPLAQINCSELPPQSVLPESGYLQFYIGGGDSYTYGLELDNGTESDFKVLFFTERQVEKPEDDMSFLDEVLKNSNSPVFEPHELRFQLKHEYVGYGDYESRFMSEFDLESIISKYPTLKETLEEKAQNIFTPFGHKLGGYAYFTQTDPREYDNSIRDFKLLFQMDSDDRIMWGDLGVGNFFIHPDDLAKRDFSTVFYTWDCS
ncbi:DUF1963 domain-containing protein [Chitinophaga pollutisoli]|uniref:DUF1963 domain-containing protein n=1 Tax=Chitinophaga pollutisoli TaxID=3133966 RepID=A0ABZ2YU68_9BACT